MCFVSYQLCVVFCISPAMCCVLCLTGRVFMQYLQLSAVVTERESLLQIWDARQKEFSQCLALQAFLREVEQGHDWLGKQEVGVLNREGEAILLLLCGGKRVPYTYAYETAWWGKIYACDQSNYTADIWKKKKEYCVDLSLFLLPWLSGTPCFLISWRLHDNNIVPVKLASFDCFAAFVLSPTSQAKTSASLLVVWSLFSNNMLTLRSLLLHKKRRWRYKQAALSSTLDIFTSDGITSTELISKNWRKCRNHNFYFSGRVPERLRRTRSRKMKGRRFDKKKLMMAQRVHECCRRNIFAH